MTDDFDFIPLYPGHTPRPYHYFEVRCTVYNKFTNQYNSMNFYISLKKTIKWLQYQPVRLPSTEYFSYEYTFKEVEDRDDILFHHITTSEDWERTVQRYFLYMCAACRWHISLKMTFLKYFNNWFKKPKINLHKYSVG